MGFGFNLFFIFILLPLIVILFVIWLLSQNKIVDKTLKFIGLSVLGLIIFSITLQKLMAKKKLQKKDYYGEYVIDRDFFRGKQADWQYENFRFEIKENDKIYFYVINKDKIKQTYIGTITTTKTYNSEVIEIQMKQPTIHIMKRNPRIWRSAWNFNLVFYSEKFNNMYFKKGTWESLDK